ncbi:MAG: dimethyladenosine transferase, rRNA (adenine1518-N6/adenine1519-N6)-dimethyltransferase [Candidatus Parcubacteria bacterium]|jgi:16S rRNA (adenine1518-N6/adenine1519-N6)-dimethyltransferase
MKLFAKKSLGQHFLNSTHVLEQIIAAAQLEKGKLVLEIGPGTGVLTRALLAAGMNVIAVEKDTRAIDVLKETFKEEMSVGKLHLIEGDILEMTPEKLSENSLLPSSYSLIANIPYYITGAILEKFLEHGPRPDKMVLLVQKEVAERIVTRDGKESILSISVKAFGTPKLVAKVPPGAFTPPPTVDSAILSITDISDRLFTEKNVDISKFFSIVKAGFAHKRKFAIRNVETVLEREVAEAVWKKTNLDPKIRAEDITISDWLNIAS